VFYSIDAATNLARIDSGFSSSLITSLAISGTDFFAGTHDGLLRSTDSGTHWKRVDSSFSNSSITSLTISGTVILAATYDGLYRSTNNGTTWEQANSGLPSVPYYPRAINFSVVGSKIFAGSSSPATIFLSTDNGSSWTDIGNEGIEPLSGISSIASVNANLFATTYYGIYISTNNGSSWTAVNVDPTSLVNSSLAVSGTNLFVGNAKGVFMSSNYGQTWEDINAGFPKFSLNNIVPASSNIRTLFISGINLFAGTNGIGVWRRALSEITGVNENGDELPKKYALEQNYPNPFNPSTTFSFSISSESFISLKVFDILGSEVATIISQEMPAGKHSHQWNASSLSSGVYFYRLQAGSFIETKKLVLLR